MPHCPKCFARYAENEKVCPECRVPLVGSLPPDPNQGELFEAVEIWQIPDEITALAVKSFMADAGVNVSVRELRASFYGNTLDPLTGWGRLVVEKHQEAKARQLLEQFLREFGSHS